MSRYTDIYQFYASVVENCYLGNGTCQLSPVTVSPQSGKHIKLGKEKIQERIREGYFSNLQELKKLGEPCPLLTIDSTPRTIYDGNFWERDPLNKGLKEPRILTAHRIHHFVPNAKAIVMLRNPVDRAISDFRFFGLGRGNFETLVNTGISWWNKCLSHFSETRCAFGFKYGGKDLTDLPPDMTWGINGAGRLRLGMYIIYIRKWLEVFPRENLLILNSDTFDKNPLSVLKDTVYPFLELDPLSAQAENKLKQLLTQGNIHKTKGKQFRSNPSIMKELRDLYAPYNQQLVELTHDQSFLWQSLDT